MLGPEEKCAVIFPRNRIWSCFGCGGSSSCNLLSNFPPSHDKLHTASRMTKLLGERLPSPLGIPRTGWHSCTWDPSSQWEAMPLISRLWGRVWRWGRKANMDLPFLLCCPIKVEARDLQPPMRWPSTVTALGPFSILRGLPQTSWLPLFRDKVWCRDTAPPLVACEGVSPDPPPSFLSVARSAPTF